MQLVREEMARLRALRGNEIRGPARSSPAAGIGAIDAAAPSLPRVADGEPELELRDAYVLDDFLGSHDEAFVRNAYRGLLRREPDAAGFADYVGALRAGRLSRTEIVGRIRYSAEGRAKGVPVGGLRVPFALRSLRRFPVVGRILGIAQYLLRLPDIVRSHERLEAELLRRDLELRRSFNRSQGILEQQLGGMHQGIARRDELAQHVAAVDRALAAKADSAGLTRLANHLLVIAERKAEVAQVEALVERIESDLAAIADRLQGLAENKAEQSELQALARGVTADLAAAGAELQAIAASKLDKPAVPDALYAGFEDRFRGTREDIKGRVSVYLPLVRASGAGSAQAPALDFGCGRGEWLEVLAAAGLAAQGVDSNPVMVAECRARGLDVVQAEGIERLRQIAPRSLGALSAIHVIEHLGFNDLIALLDEARRVLRPGGLLVLETPNPENLVVGACNFYYDPTHRQPLPPEPMRHVTQARGFTGVEIWRLHPATPPSRVQPGPVDPWAARIDALLYGPQDYAIIARNPA